MRTQRDSDTLMARQTVLQAPDDLSFDEADEAHVSGNGKDPVVIAEMETTIEMLSVGEAVQRLDFTGQPALLFRSRANGLLNMIYRRPDGNIGWVDPQNVKH